MPRARVNCFHLCFFKVHLREYTVVRWNVLLLAFVAKRFSCCWGAFRTALYHTKWYVFGFHVNWNARFLLRPLRSLEFWWFYTRIETEKKTANCFLLRGGQPQKKKPPNHAVEPHSWSGGSGNPRKADLWINEQFNLSHHPASLFHRGARRGWLGGSALHRCSRIMIATLGWNVAALTVRLLWLSVLFGRAHVFAHFLRASNE